MFSKGPQVRTLLLVALFLFGLPLFALDDEGQLNDDPGAIDSINYNQDSSAAQEASDDADREMDQTPEHAEYPVEETHQVLKYVQARADAPTYSRAPQVKPATPEKVAAAPVVSRKHPAKKPLKIKKKPLKKRPKNRHTK